MDELGNEGASRWMSLVTKDFNEDKNYEFIGIALLKMTSFSNIFLIMNKKLSCQKSYELKLSRQKVLFKVQWQSNT